MPIRRFKRPFMDEHEVLEASQNKDFGSSSPAENRRDKNAEPSFDHPRMLTGSLTRILKYVEDLKGGSNAEIGPKDHFKIASIHLPHLQQIHSAPNQWKMVFPQYWQGMSCPVPLCGY